MNTAEKSELAHKLRNKLNNISMNTELIKLLVQKKQSDEKILSSADKILQECSQCSQLITQNESTDTVSKP